ncbi:ABC transporter permease [Pseudomonas sp. RC10]|uniref:ABC transporter permease n=1 Tax=Pseudomonas bambusae TaxID=3139142 RepID=UPI0031388A93
MTRSPSGPLWARLLSLPLLLIAWQLICEAEWVNPLLFPGPLAVSKALLDYLYSGSGWEDLGWSLLRVVVGYCFGAVVGVSVGLLTGTRPVINGLLTPIFQVLRPIPPIAFVPLVVLWFGLGEGGKFFLVFWGVFFTVWLATHIGVQRVNVHLLQAAQSLGAPRRAMLWTVQLPATLPSIFLGLRTAIGIAFYTLVAAELAGAYAGLAYRLEVTQQNMQVAYTMAGLVLLGVISACADRLFQWASARIVHWN